MTKKYLDDSGYTYTINKLKSMIQNVKTGDTLPIGSIVVYGGTTPPNNWLICDGSAVSRTVYADLFAVIGTTYGAGDGSTTFNLPDYRGRVGVGLDTNDSDFNVLGKTLGSKYLQKHSHNYTRAPLYGYEWTSAQDILAQNTSVGLAILDTTNTTGTGNSGNIQPSIVTNYIIKAFQSAGVVAGVSNTTSASTTDVYSCNYINNLRNVMTIYATKRATYTLGESAGNVVISHFNLYNKVGDKLTHNNSSIVIGEGVSKVLVSANLGYWKTSQSAQCLMKILKNNVEVASSHFQSVTDVNSTQTIYLAPILIDVQEGDVFKIAVSGPASQTFAVLSDNIGRAGLTIEVVK